MVDRYFAEYASYHTDRRNLLCHEIGIPLIVLSLFSLLQRVKLGPLDLAIILGALVIFFYLRLDVRLALIALIAFAALYIAGRVHAVVASGRCFYRRLDVSICRSRP